MRCFLLLGLIASVSGRVYAQDKLPELSVEQVQGAGQSQEGPRVGDELILRVEAPASGVPLSHSKEVVLEGDEKGEKLIELGWQFDGKVRPDRQDPERVLFSVVPTKPGNLILPSLVLKDSSGSPIARTQEFAVEVQSSIAPNDPRRNSPEEVEPAVRLQEPGWILYAKWAGVGALFLIAVLGIILAWKKRKKRKVPGKVQTDDEIALEQLKTLEESPALDQERFKEFHFALSEILKTYLGARFRFDALESTSKEICDELNRRNAISPSDREELVFIFDYLDLVKFTDYKPSSKTSREALTKARDFVLRTRYQSVLQERQ